MKPTQPFPKVATAVWLTLLGSFSALFLMAAVAAGSGAEVGAAGAAFGLAFGFGGVGTIAARAVPPPQAERMGLRGFRLRFLLPILLLAPITILGSEIDNVARAWFPAPDAAEVAQRLQERLRVDEWLVGIQTGILTIGIAPVVEEFFFRGVVQQGVVSQLGVARGVALTALLFGLGHGSPGLSAAAWLAAATGTFLYGVAFGMLRIWSGSILPPILLHTAVNAVGMIGMAFAEQLPIPGYNAPGEHTPAAIVVGALLSVSLALVLARRGADLEPPPAAPVRKRESDPSARD